MMEQVSINNQSRILQQLTDHALLEAAGILSIISHIETHLSVVSMGMVNVEDVADFFDEDTPEMVAVSQRLDGVVNGHVLFMLNDDRSTILIRELLNEHAQLRELTEMEEEALTEVGNIIINSCLNNYAEILKGRVSCQLPQLTRGHHSQLIQRFSHEVINNELFYIQINILTARQTYSGYLLCTRLSWEGRT